MQVQTFDHLSKLFLQSNILVKLTDQRYCSAWDRKKLGKYKSSIWKRKKKSTLLSKWSQFLLSVCYIRTHTNLHKREAGFDLTLCSDMNVRPEGTRELTMPWLMKYSAKYTSPRGTTNPSKPCTQHRQCNQTHTETLKSEVKRKALTLMMCSFSVKVRGPRGLSSVTFRGKTTWPV